MPNNSDVNRPGLEPIRPVARRPQMRPNGEPVWHNLTPTRFVTALPPVQGPVNALKIRATKDPRARTLDAYGSTQLTRDHDVPKS